MPELTKIGMRGIVRKTHFLDGEEQVDFSRGKCLSVWDVVRNKTTCSDNYSVGERSVGQVESGSTLCET